MNKIIVIVGPTATGKTNLSISLAKQFNGEIINADSTQVYKNFNIGTSKIKNEEMQGIEHHLLSFIADDEKYNIYRFQNEGRAAIEQILLKNKVPIVVGGSGLYLKSLLYDYNLQPMIKKNNFDHLTNEQLYQKLTSLDKMIDISPNNRQRLEGALNFYDQHGFSITQQNGKNNPKYDLIIIGLTCDRNILYERITEKTDLMLKNGLLNEVANLYEINPNNEIARSIIGYKELYDYLDGKFDLATAIAKIKTNSKRYAKRQYTWFNNQMPVKWFNIMEKDYLSKIIDYIKIEFTK